MVKLSDEKIYLFHQVTIFWIQTSVSCWLDAVLRRKYMVTFTFFWVEKYLKGLQLVSR